MVRKEADTPTGGCHAEAHLSRFADGSRLGAHPGFESATEYRVRFDTNCNAAVVGFFQYKNCGGPDRWKYLVDGVTRRMSRRDAVREACRSGAMKATEMRGYCAVRSHLVRGHLGAGQQGSALENGFR